MPYDAILWTQIAASSEWLARDSHTSVVMPDGSIVLMGGLGVAGHLNDTWRSIDNGATWMCMSATAGWTAREAHTSVAMPDGGIVLMGGYDGSRKNDVWRSIDNGATWSCISANAEWTARYAHTSVALPDGSIMLMGGYDGSYKNDVWRSVDNGATWTLASTTAWWPVRRYHTSVAMPDGSVVLMGGDGYYYQLNDVWRTVNKGVTWTRMSATAGWTAREAPTSVAMPNGSIVLMGGFNNSSGFLNDTWCSIDNGATWVCINATAGWAARCYHTSVVMSADSIVLMGGYGYVALNDVWQGILTNALVANFSAEPIIGFTPLEVQFVDLSTGTPTNWIWDFDDGWAWGTQYPVHTYKKSGAYSPSLTVLNEGGSDTITKWSFILVAWTVERYKPMMTLQIGPDPGTEPIVLPLPPCWIDGDPPL